MNFAPAQTGNGVYFMATSGDAYYKFTGATLGSIFNVNQGQISFYLKSRHTFAQRTATPFRVVLDVQDAAKTQVFGFYTLASSGSLMFGYKLAGAAYQFYYPPAGTEDTLFGNGVTVKVTMTWSAGVAKLYLNDALVQQSSYVASAPNWGAASNFDLGAYEYQPNAGSNMCDDIIDEFTVTASAGSPALDSSASTAPVSEAEASTLPVITRLQNGADEAAPVVCSPAAVATLVGHFLPDAVAPMTDRSGLATSLAGVRVLINGSYSPVLYASPSQVDFLCPAVSPSTSLGIAVETAAGLSNPVETTVEEASPGIFTTAWPAPESATLSIRATGIDWLAKFPAVRASVRIGTRYLAIDSITPDPLAPGVATLTVTLPADLFLQTPLPQSSR